MLLWAIAEGVACASALKNGAPWVAALDAVAACLWFVLGVVGTNPTMQRADGDALARPAWGHNFEPMSDEAEQRGWQLLQDHLEAKQYETLRETGCIVVVGSRGTSYWLLEQATYNVIELDAFYRPVTTLCVVPTEAVPRG